MYNNTIRDNTTVVPFNFSLLVIS